MQVGNTITEWKKRGKIDIRDWKKLRNFSIFLLQLILFDEYCVLHFHCKLHYLQIAVDNISILLE